MGVDAAPAATVVLLRPSSPGFEIFLVRRHDNIAFMGGAHVFPGGRVDAVDRMTTGDPFRTAAIRELFEEAGVRADPGALVPFARWITPDVETRRFDTMFFLTPLPPGELALHDGNEATEGLWITPAQAIDRAARGEIALPPPTWTTLSALSTLSSVGEALAWAAGQAVPTIRPRVIVQDDGTRLIALPGDALNEAVAGFTPSHTRFILQEGRWRPA
jgi:8-oxo-dGTP pyrophosphatase MutT (NUDIX family)